MLARKALAGTAGAPKEYVEDVFSTFLYTGNGSTQTITNGIDLAGKGGLVWFKSRNNSTFANSPNCLTDSVTGFNKYLISEQTQFQQNWGSDGPSPTSTGFTLPINGSVPYTNYLTGSTYASWTFRKQAKFFDIVTYTGNGSNRTISHNLGSVPGWIIVKRTDTTGAWATYHRSLANTEYLVLNTTAAKATGATYWNSTTPTSTEFSLGTATDVNANGGTYVAYLFAHDAGGFGDAGSDSIIKCDSYTGAGSDITVNLGYEPQFLLIKPTNTTGDWWLTDTMRGLNTSGSIRLEANTSDAEAAIYDGVRPTSTGFFLPTGTVLNDSGNTYIYIAIRRGPMKTPTSGTEVFAVTSFTGVDTAQTAGFPVDLVMNAENISATTQWQWVDRLRGATKKLESNATNAEGSVSDGAWDSNTTVKVSSSGNSYKRSYPMFRRAPGFFDIVCYTGTGSATTFSHNLGVAPELMIVKRRSNSNDWAVYANNDNTDYLVLNTTAATADDNTYWNDTSPTSSVFSVGTNNATNASGSTYVAYLFASVSGVSKIGSYTGNGSSVTVTTDFQPRFILVKRTDSTGDWIVSDSARGLVSADEPALFLNSTAAETTGQDWVDVSSTSFTVNETALNANVNTATYIYLCVA